MIGATPGDRLSRSDLAAVLLLVAAATAAAVVLRSNDPAVYRFILGDLDPVWTTLAVSVLGLGSLHFLAHSGWFRVGGSARGLVAAAVLGIGLTMPVIVVDGLGGFPPDMNVPAPQSLLFYPSIALVAELMFHVVPLALLALAAGVTPLERDWARWLAMILVSTIEPALQVLWGVAHSPWWANAYVGVHLLVFNLVAVAFFRRQGFLSMVLFRLSYYLVWHIVWGHLRLDLLFGGAA